MYNISGTFVKLRIQTFENTAQVITEDIWDTNNLDILVLGKRVAQEINLTASSGARVVRESLGSLNRLKTSHALTEYPESKSWTRTWKPMKPVPPVTCVHER